MAMTAIVSAERRLEGIFTDGDLRRLIGRQANLADLTIDQVMTRRPRTIGVDSLATEALRVMEDHKIIQLVALDANGLVAGAIHLHDLIAAKLT
jgi:arabinose-5-phosphate isomerase